MNGLVKFIAPLVLLGALVAPSMAQNSGINQRLHDQNARIRSGVRTHELNRYAVHNLRNRDRGIRTAERRDRRNDHGHLTGMERARLQHRLNQSSRDIYNRKHDVR